MESVEFWDLDKPKLARALEVARAIVTKTPPDVGESKTVEL